MTARPMRFVTGKAGKPGTLDLLETNRTAGGREPADPTRPGGADGEFSPGWRTCRTATPESRPWADGWDRGARCPPDVRQAAPLAPGYAAHSWREVGPVGGAAWREAHDYRRRVLRLCRRAGYVARHRWAVRADDDGRAHYVNGPAAGMRVVDPWETARRLSGCAAAWYVQARITDAGELRAISLPRLCRQGHVCPVCSARESSTLAAGLSALIAAEGGGVGVLATLTHRDAVGESLTAALARLRDAMGRLWSGRERAAWRARFPAHFYGVEVTYNAEKRTWHAHAHLVARVAVEHENAAEWLGMAWEAATVDAARAAGMADRYGWDSWAGGVRAVEGRPVWIPSRHPAWRPGDAWGWYRPLDLSDADATYQACKYPTCAADLPPVQLAEYLTAARGRRWHDGGGTWRGARQRAADLDTEPLPGIDAHTGAPVEPYDIGRNVSRCGPADCPHLDTVLPGLGIWTLPDTPPEGFARWRLSALAPDVLASVCAAVEGYGGRWVVAPEQADAAGRPAAWIEVPRAIVAGLLFDWHEHGAEQRRQAEERRAAVERRKRLQRAQRRIRRRRPAEPDRADTTAG